MKSVATNMVFLALLRDAGLPAPVQEHRFDPDRRWRFDYAWPAHKIALENEGGLFVHGRHSRGAGMLKDQEKYNRAAVLGWFVLKTTPTLLTSRQNIQNIADLFKRQAVYRGPPQEAGCTILIPS